MKQVYIINENHPQLLLFFAGWAADETPFKQYRPKDMDYMICYDYRTLDFDYSIFDRYRQDKRGSLVHGCVDGLSHTEPSLPGQGVQPGVQRNYIPHRQSGRYPREHLSGYSRRAYPPQRSRSSCAACARTATPTRHSWK